MLEFDAREFRNACGNFATGVTVITTRTPDDGDHGMTANAFMSISLDPPLVAIAIAEKARILTRIQNAKRFGVSILPRSLERVAWHFAGKCGDTLLDVFQHYDDLPIINGALAAFSANVVNEIVAGDHTVFVGRVSSFFHRSGHEPLVFNQGRFMSLELPRI